MVAMILCIENNLSLQKGRAEPVSLVDFLYDENNEKQKHLLYRTNINSFSPLTFQKTKDLEDKI